MSATSGRLQRSQANAGEKRSVEDRLFGSLNDFWQLLALLNIYFRPWRRDFFVFAAEANLR